MKEKRPTISPNFNFLGQLLDFEKKIKTTPSAPLQPGTEAPARPEEAGPAAGGQGQLEPLTLPCVLADGDEEPRLALALNGLQLSDGSFRLKRSFSLDIKSFGESVSGASQGAVPADKEGSNGAGGKTCQFSPVEEVSEQSSPETPPPRPKPCPSTTGGSRAGVGVRSGATTSFLLGLSSSQQHLAGAGPGVWSGGALLKGWHSDVLLAGGWYLDSARFYSTSAILGGGVAVCSRGPEGVQRRRWQGGRPGGSGNSRRSWHEESSFEKQLKRRSCHMELGEGRRDSEERANQDGFSSSMELIQVS